MEKKENNGISSRLFLPASLLFHCYVYNYFKPYVIKDKKII